VEIQVEKEKRKVNRPRSQFHLKRKVHLFNKIRDKGKTGSAWK
jgi:hypothetical protein